MTGVEAVDWGRMVGHLTREQSPVVLVEGTMVLNYRWSIVCVINSTHMSSVHTSTGLLANGGQRAQYPVPKQYLFCLLLGTCIGSGSLDCRLVRFAGSLTISQSNYRVFPEKSSPPALKILEYFHFG